MVVFCCNLFEPLGGNGQMMTLAGADRSQSGRRLEERKDVFLSRQRKLYGE
jgi:hypothetical protein